MLDISPGTRLLVSSNSQITNSVYTVLQKQKTVVSWMMVMVVLHSELCFSESSVLEPGSSGWFAEGAGATLLLAVFFRMALASGLQSRTLLWIARHMIAISVARWKNLFETNVSLLRVVPGRL